MSKPIWLVQKQSGNGHMILAVFDDEDLANKFSEFIKGSFVEKEIIYSKMPKLYRYFCEMDLKTGEAHIEECTPSTEQIFMHLEGKKVYTVGETEAEARYYAERFVTQAQKNQA